MSESEPDPKEIVFDSDGSWYAHKDWEIDLEDDSMGELWFNFIMAEQDYDNFGIISSCPASEIVDADWLEMHNEVALESYVEAGVELVKFLGYNYQEDESFIHPTSRSFSVKGMECDCDKFEL